MKLYKCELCGRVFDRTMPHQCANGQYRKHNIVFTEFEDVDNEYIKKSEVDVEEKSFPNIPRGALILEKTTEPKIEFMINWEQERVNVAQDTMLEMLKKIWDDVLFRRSLSNAANEKDQLLPEYIASYCVTFADALIAELKKDH